MLNLALVAQRDELLMEQDILEQHLGLGAHHIGHAIQADEPLRQPSPAKAERLELGERARQELDEGSEEHL